MKVLFVCNLGENRSRTAAHMFKDKYETKYAGVLDNLVTKEQMEWADVVVVMEEHQKRRLRAMFPDTNKRIRTPTETCQSQRLLSLAFGFRFYFCFFARAHREIVGLLEFLFHLWFERLENKTAILADHLVS